MRRRLQREQRPPEQVAKAVTSSPPLKMTIEPSATLVATIGSIEMPIWVKAERHGIPWRTFLPLWTCLKLIGSPPIGAEAWLPVALGSSALALELEHWMRPSTVHATKVMNHAFFSTRISA